MMKRQSYYFFKLPLNCPIVKHGSIFDHHYPKRLAEWSLPSLKLCRVWEDVCENLCCKLLDYSDREILLYDGNRFKIFDTISGNVNIIKGQALCLSQVETVNGTVVGLNEQQQEVLVWLDINSPPLVQKLKEFNPDLKYTIYGMPSKQFIIASSGSIDCYYINAKGLVKIIAFTEPAYYISELNDQQTFAISCANMVKLCTEDGQEKVVCQKMGSYYRELCHFKNIFYTLEPSQITAWKTPEFTPLFIYRAQNYNFSKMWITSEFILAMDKNSHRIIAWNLNNPKPILMYTRELFRINKVLPLPQGRACLLKSVESVINGENIFISRLDVVNLYDQTQIAHKEIRNLKFNIDMNSLTVGSKNSILFICKSTDSATIISWDYIENKPENKKIPLSTKIYPFNRILIKSEGYQIYDHHFTCILSFKSDFKVFLLNEEKFAVASETQLEILRITGKQAKHVTKVMLPQPITKLQPVHWPDKQQLICWLKGPIRGPIPVQEKLYLEGISSRFLWSSEFEIEDSKDPVKRETKIAEGGIVQYNKKVQIWPLNWQIQIIDGMWWEGGLLAVPQQASHMIMVYPPKECLALDQ